jgi:predicted Zn finger-like uncharacterized protein
MILTCPDCATRYFVSDRRFGPNGRKVRCGGCGATWHAHLEEEAPIELGVASSDDGEAMDLNEEPLSFKPVEAHDLPTEELPRAFRAKAEQKRRARKAVTTGAVWAGLALGFALVLTAAWAFRVDVVRVFPRAAAAYALARVNATGLEFEAVKAQPSDADPGVVVVEGRLHNIVSQAATVPPLRVTLLDKKGIRMTQRVFTLDVPPLASGARLPFRAALPDPRSGATDVDVSFALDMSPPKPKRPAPAAKVAQAVRPAPPPVSQPASQPAPQQAPKPAAAPALRPALDAGRDPATSARAPIGLRGLDRKP